MKIVKKLTTILLSLFFLLLPFIAVEASSTQCPSSMDPNSIECLNYLNKQLEDLQKNQSSLQSKLNNEQYQQLSLQEKITYINTQISQTEKVIDTLEVEIAAKDLDINLLSQEIQTKEDNLSTLKQEITVLKDNVDKRVTESYKYSFVGALELILDSHNIDTILRKTKYLIETREKDRSSLEEYNTKSESLQQEEDVLASQKANLQQKRNDVESEKTDLVDQRNSLASQKAEKNNLLAESQSREKAYKAQLASVSAAIDAADNAVSELVMKLYNSGQLGQGSNVTAGQIIGYEGHTGCAYGSHLHFEIRNSSNVKQNPLNYLNGGTLYGIVTSRIYLAPMSGAMLTQGYSYSHNAIDLVSSTMGNQNYDQYTVKTGICPQVNSLISNYGNKAYLRGEGAPIYAIASGKVYYGVDQYGGKYALVAHNDGAKSLYVHLR